MQKFNYHTHTYRCLHANGTDEEYVVAAIKAGLKVLGFSDHVPHPGYETHPSRMPYSMKDEYLTSLKALKEKYKDQIDIKIGFECEYYPEYEEYYRELRQEVDYLILGQHSGFPSMRADYYYEFSQKDYDDYARTCIDGMRTGLFAYLCHPDYVLLNIDDFDDELIEMFHKIFKVAKECDVPIEINLNGPKKPKRMVNGRLAHSYPNEEILKIAKDYGCRFVYGADAHDPKQITRFAELQVYVEDLLKDLKIEVDKDFKV